MKTMLHFCCDYCGTRTPSDLNRWENIYSTGEVYTETCTGCGREFTAEMKFTPVDRAEYQPNEGAMLRAIGVLS